MQHSEETWVKKQGRQCLV